MPKKSKITRDELKNIYLSWKEKKFLLGSMSKGAMTIGGTRLIGFQELIRHVESQQMARGWVKGWVKRDVYNLDFYSHHLYEILDDGTLKNIHGTLRMMLKMGMIVRISGKARNYRGVEIDVVYPKFIPV